MSAPSTPRNRKNPESWVGQIVQAPLKMMNAKGTVVVEGKLLENNEDSILLLVKSDKGRDVEMSVDRDNIVYVAKACDAQAVEVVPAGVLHQMANGRR